MATRRHQTHRFGRHRRDFMGDFFAGRRINERARSGSAKNNCTGGNVRSARVKKFTEWNLRNVPQVRNTMNIYMENYIWEREREEGRERQRERESSSVLVKIIMELCILLADWTGICEIPLLRWWIMPHANAHCAIINRLDNIAIR